MSKKKLSEHPAVIIIGILASLSAIGGLTYTMGANSNSGYSPPVEGNSPSISNSANQDATVNDIDGDNNSVTSESNNNNNVTTSQSNNDSSINSRSEGNNSPSISNSN